jgi:hypothetical protein
MAMSAMAIATVTMVMVAAVVADTSRSDGSLETHCVSSLNSFYSVILAWSLPFNSKKDNTLI